MGSLHLVDGHARSVSYLRLSLTDRCNYRCQYCMPEAGVAVEPKSEQLTTAEIVRLVRALQPLGLTRVRLTGGEPTVRRELVDIVRALSGLGLVDLAMTTNGERLAELAQPLLDAGLSRLNVSIDSLDETRFATITRRGHLPRVLAGIDAAIAAGFRSTKLNTVVLGGFNDDELPALCRYAWDRGLTPRFIEEMPLSDGALFSSGRFVSALQMRARLTEAFGPLVAELPGESAGALPGVGPARYYRAGGSSDGGRLGIISAVTEPFCERCNRIRVSATGRLHACLSSDEQVNLLDELRSNASDEQLVERVQAALQRKVVSHQFSTCGSGAPKKHMVTIGG